MRLNTHPAFDCDVKALRETHYNATATELRRVHDSLMVFRILPDQPIPAAAAGQYVTLGLGYWEPRLPGTQPESVEAALRQQLALRAYSLSCHLLNDQRELVTLRSETELEFYLALVRAAPRPPALSPRLFLLQPGDRLYASPRARGSYTLASVRPEDDLLFAATGTGEAPHNAMLAELLAHGHAGRICCATCVRFARDLAYLEAHRQLEQQFPNYRYLPLTTREPHNLDPAHPRYVGKQYLQDYLASGALERDGGIRLDPARVHVFLCGSPTMVGVPVAAHGEPPRYPQPPGMIELLEQRGFRHDLPRQRGNVHFEKYW